MEPAAQDLLPPELATALVQRSTEVVTVISRTGRVDFVSSSCAQPLGRPTDDWTGHQVTDEIHPSDLGRFVKKLTGADNGEPYEPGTVLPIRMWCPAAGWVATEAAGFAPVRFAGSDGYVVSFRDFTGRLSHDAALQLAAETLVEPADAATDNRALAVNELLPGLAALDGTSHGICVVSVRISNFDAIVDSHGVEAAHQATLAVADALQRSTRPDDMVGRLMDRRLLVVGRNVTDTRSAWVFGARLLASAEAIEHDGDIPVETTIGFAVASKGDDFGQVLDFAIDAEQFRSGD